MFHAKTRVIIAPNIIIKNKNCSIEITKENFKKHIEKIVLIIENSGADGITKNEIYKRTKNIPKIVRDDIYKRLELDDVIQPIKEIHKEPYKQFIRYYYSGDKYFYGGK